jgi:hypothetical protein
MNFFARQRLRWQQRWIVWTNWEYWSANWFYVPLAPWLAYLSARNGHPCFFTAANPGIFTGGLGFESKFDTLQLIPEPFRPTSIRIDYPRDYALIPEQLRVANIGFPLVVKPDMGFRGFLVKKIEDEKGLQEYLEQFPIPVIAQEYLRGRQEFGVLYYRMPGEASGRVSSLTVKELLTVTGDGVHALRELITAHPRALLQWEVLERNYASMMDDIPAFGQRVGLGIVGNHCRGARFINGNAHINSELLRVFDGIASQMDGFNYGRFDIKCDDVASLQRGEGVKIIEVNGVCSEPVHIYDPAGIDYFGAIVALGKHWKVVADIARRNHRLGVPYLSPRKMIEVLWGARRYFRQLKRLLS